MRSISERVIVREKYRGIDIYEKETVFWKTRLYSHAPNKLFMKSFRYE